jgi:hypothetical protein
MPLRRVFAWLAIVVVVVAFLGIGITAALFAGREVSKINPTPTPSRSASPTPGVGAAATP